VRGFRRGRDEVLHPIGYDVTERDWSFSLKRLGLARSCKADTGTDTADSSCERIRGVP
jgi:hypothetical protein